MRSTTRRAGLLAPIALFAPVVVGFVYLDGPPPARTGGFGEPTCRECHFDGPERDPAVSVRLEGVPERWEPGAEYELRVVLARPDLAMGGFQLAARYAAGASRGGQAGRLSTTSDRVAVVDSGGVLYAQHAPGGTALTSPDTVRWGLRWTAPARAGSAVAFHVAANAANGDASELGDAIVTVERRSGEPCSGKTERR